MHPAPSAAPFCFLRRRSRAFTLVELCTVVVILAVLVALSTAGIQKVLLMSKHTEILSDLRAGCAAIQLCAADNGGYYPRSCGIQAATPRWPALIASYLSGKTMLATDYKGDSFAQYPELLAPNIVKVHDSDSDYGCNGAVLLRPIDVTPVKYQSAAHELSVAAVTHPSETVLLMTATQQDSNPVRALWYVNTSNFYRNAYTSLVGSDWNTGFYFCGFCDGHTEMVPKDVFDNDRARYLLP